MRPEYNWPHGGMPRPEDRGFRGEPPVDWRGPAPQRPPYAGRGDELAVYSPPGASGPPGGPPGGGRFAEPPPGFPGSFPPGVHGQSEGEKAFEAASLAAEAAMPALTDAPGAGDADDPADAPLPPQTAAERLAGVRLVRSALSERLVRKLQDAGVPVDGPGHLSSLSGLAGAACAEEMGSEDQPTAASSRCSRLGLDGDIRQRARLPPPMPGVPRLPVCIFEPTLGGLWEKFRQRCGTPVPADPAPLPCELRTSRGGGNVVVPLVAG